MDEQPTIQVPAQDVLDRFNAANELGCKLEGVSGILTLVTDKLTGATPENSALHMVATLVEECVELANSLQWAYSDEAAAKKALGA